MSPDTKIDNKKSILSRIPKLGNTSQLIIIIGIFLIILIPMIIINLQQVPIQNQINKDIAAIQNILSTPLAQNADTIAEIKRTETEKLTLISRFASESSSSLIAEQLMQLAKKYNIVIGKLQTSSSQVSMVVSQNSTKTIDFPAISILLTMQGQAAQFSNYLIALEAVPSAKISSIDIHLAQNKGEDDSAIIKLDILIYK
jgi:hypothetical protein